MTDDDLLLRAFHFQARVCTQFGSIFYGELINLASELPDEVRALFAPWEGLSFDALMEAAVVLRFLAAAHDLALSSDDPALTAAFPPTPDARAAWEAIQAAIARDPVQFAAFMVHEPQTNEVRRSACLLPGFLTVAAETGLPLACLELGASAGLNQLWSRYHYDYGRAGEWGDPASPLRLDSAWSGPRPPLDAALTVARTAACDGAPIDIADPAQRRRLTAYLWPDQTDRIGRFDAAAAMATAAGVTVDKADAADWVARHAAPTPGVATVVFHSVFWSYVPPATQGAIRATLAEFGRAASGDAPLAWLRMEPPDGVAFPIELRLTVWPGGEDRRLAAVHAHGATIDWAD